MCTLCHCDQCRFLTEAEFLVTARVKCPKCGGSGVVAHPGWLEYWNDEGNRSAQPTTYEQDLEWFKSHGWDVDDRLPPEQIECGECDGMGHIEKAVSLREALIALWLDDRNGDISDSDE